MDLDNNHLDELLESHLQKEQKVSVYKPRVEANLVNGHPTFKATWSWWAFFGTWAFFLYRKMYLVAVLFFFATVLTAFIPFSTIIIMIISGMSAFYFYTKKLNSDLDIAGIEDKPLHEVKDNLSKLGGYNSWVVWVAVVFYTIVMLSVIIGFLGLAL